MPTAPARPCSSPRCPHLRPCPVHGAKAYPSSTVRRQREPGKRLMDTQYWRRARLAFLAAHPLCVECERRNIVTLATDVDHIDPHKGDTEVFRDQERWQALCSSCHGRKTREEMRNR